MSQLSARDPSRHVQACLWLVLATALWGISFPCIKALWLTQEKLVPSPPLFLAAAASVFRFGVAGLIIAIISARHLRQLTRNEIAQGVGLGLFGGAGIVFQMDGLAHTPASTSAFLTQFTCLLIPLWVALRDRALPGPVIILSTAMVLAGVAILSGFDFKQLRMGRGEAETILATVFFTGQILWLERPRYAGNRVTNFTVVMFATITVMLAPLVLATAPTVGAVFTAYQSPPALAFAGLLTVACTLGAYTLMNVWQPHVSATEAGLIYCVEPIFASLLAAFLPGWFSRFAGIDYANERLTRELLLGGGLITVANVLIQFESWRQRRNVPSAGAPVSDPAR